MFKLFNFCPPVPHAAEYNGIRRNPARYAMLASFVRSTGHRVYRWTCSTFRAALAVWCVHQGKRILFDKRFPLLLPPLQHKPPFDSSTPPFDLLPLHRVALWRDAYVSHVREQPELTDQVYAHIHLQIMQYDRGY